MNQKRLIEKLSDSYLFHKRQLIEDEQGIKRRPYEKLEGARYIVSHTETVVAGLPERERFIIYNEVILGKRGNWYEGLLSSATYYRHRRTAYRDFLRELNE